MASAKAFRPVDRAALLSDIAVYRPQRGVHCSSRIHVKDAVVIP